MPTPASPFQTVSFGPTRAIGLSLLVPPDGADFYTLWADQLFPRAAEISRPPNPAAFGIARCLPNATDGSYEYLATLEATPASPLPTGMLDIPIPAATYAVFLSPSLEELPESWQRAAQTLANQSLWIPYCSRAGCRCREFPSFEYHTAASRASGQTPIYIAVHPA